MLHPKPVYTMNLKPLAPEYAKHVQKICLKCPNKPKDKDIRDGVCTEEICDGRIDGWIVRGMHYWKQEITDENQV